MWNPYYAVGGLIMAQTVVGPAAPEWWGPFIQGGIPGLVLLWFMLRGEKKLDEQTKAQREMAHALNTNAKSNMVIVLSLKNLDSNVSELAKQLADEIEHNEGHARTDR